MPASLWSEGRARDLNDLDGLVYRSNLLGADRSIVNYGGGNTSIKSSALDHRGRQTHVLSIKGSGSNLATIRRDDFTPVVLEDLHPLRERDAMTDEEMVEYLSHCLLHPGAPRPSIETLLHGFLPFDHVDHTHPEAAIAFCCSSDGEELTRDCFGDEVVWVPYVRPGFALAKLALEALERNPSAKAMFLAKHGLVTWGKTGRESYDRTIDILSRAEEHLEARVDVGSLFGGQRFQMPNREHQERVMADILPVIRGSLSALVGAGKRVILHWDRSSEVLEFVNSMEMPHLARTGAACPDHVMYTKFMPMLVDAADSGATASTGNIRELEQAVRRGIHDYVAEYSAFFERHKEPGVEMLDPGPRVILIPGFGLVAAGRDGWTAANAASLYRSAIAVMRWASSASEYESLTPQEAWDIEYWPLELYKLTLRPPDKELSGRVAIVTGGAGAIGRASARRLMDEGAHVAIADLDEMRAGEIASELGERFPCRIVAMEADAGDETDNERMLQSTILRFGGVDVVVPNAGIASAGAIETTETDEWDAVQRVLLRGYFLACRAAFRVFKRQGLGGAIVINASKNGLAAGKDAIAYATAKAAEIHMARCLAEEGGEAGIRVNAVAPDAVIQGSGLWSKEWRQERARAYGFPEEQLEEFYRNRNTLKVEVTAEDVAEAILFLASDRSAKTTGCVITVDGGLASAYPR